VVSVAYFPDKFMNLHQDIAPAQVVSFPPERPNRDPKKGAEIEEMQLALKVALYALDVLEARVPKTSGTPARSGRVINRFASRIAEGLSRARAAG
jgi:hypothetical protein